MGSNSNPNNLVAFFRRWRGKVDDATLIGKLEAMSHRPPGVADDETTTIEIGEYDQICLFYAWQMIGVGYYGEHGLNSTNASVLRKLFNAASNLLRDFENLRNDGEKLDDFRDRLSRDSARMANQIIAEGLFTTGRASDGSEDSE